MAFATAGAGDRGTQAGGDTRTDPATRFWPTQRRQAVRAEARRNDAAVRRRIGIVTDMKTGIAIGVRTLRTKACLGIIRGMPIELEAKMKVEDLTPVRARLVELGAKRLAKRLEVNVFYDTAEKSLLSRDSGLRVRLHANEDGSRQTVMTYKGKQVDAGGLKNRLEIEVVVDDLERATQLLLQLGYTSDLRFEKRRESFELDGCRVELDELPGPLGVFVEIEGETKAAIEGVRSKLGLLDAQLSTVSYAAIVAEHLARAGKKELVFLPVPQVIALMKDLIFASKVRAAAKVAGTSVKIVRDGATLEGGRLLIVTLNEPGHLPHALAWKAKTGGRVIAFGSHVATESLEQAKRLGVDRVLSNGQFSAQIDAILTAEAVQS